MSHHHQYKYYPEDDPLNPCNPLRHNFPQDDPQPTNPGCSAIIFFIIGIFFLSLLGSCASHKQLTAPARKHIEYHADTILKSRVDTVYRMRTSRDTIYRHDSVYVSQYQKGDTVYKYKIVYTDKVRYSFCTDTLWRMHTDTLWRFRTDSLLRSDTITITRPVERHLTTWQRASMGVGKFVLTGMLVLSVCAVIYGIYKLILYLRRNGKL